MKSLKSIFYITLLTALGYTGMQAQNNADSLSAAEQNLKALYQNSSQRTKANGGVREISSSENDSIVNAQRELQRLYENSPDLKDKDQSSTPPQAVPLTLTLDAGFYGNYIFRNLLYGKESAQANVVTMYGNVIATQFVNRDNLLQRVNEIDLILTYLQPISSKLSVGSYVNHLVFPGNSEMPKSTEIGAIVNYTLPIDEGMVSATLAHDIDFDHGSNLTLAATKTTPVFGQPITASVGGNYNEQYWNQMKGWSGIEAKITTDIPLGTVGEGTLILRPTIVHVEGYQGNPTTTFGNLAAVYTLTK